MYSRLLVLLVFLGLSALLLSFQHVDSKPSGDLASEPQVVKAWAFALSPSVKSIARRQIYGRPKDGSAIPLVEVNEDDDDELQRSANIGRHDADNATASLTAIPMPTPSLSFDGLSNFNNLDLYGGFYIPPDPTGDVGPYHYVQAVNAAIRVYDKNGNALSAPFKFSDLLAPLDTPCSTRNDGDPTVVYDPLADRWLISQYCTAFPPFRQMIAISRTGDPTGQYFVYEFVMPNVRLNDYPKLAVWSDGYYMSSDEFFGSDYVGSGAFAFDKAKMLMGDPSAAYVYFHLPQAPPDRLGGILPSDLDGLTPPPSGSPNTFVGYSATEYGDPIDGIRLFDFHVDFEYPARSTFRERTESPVPVAAFDPTSPAGRTDIAQPAPGEWLDSISDRLMYRIAYRNFGDHESLVFNQTVRMTPVTDTYRAGVRVYELRRSDESSYMAVEQSTIGDTSVSRWLGSAAQDHQGNIAVSYSLSSEEKRPSIVYSGKLSSDIAGTFRAEANLIEGTGVQKAFGFRWGDYSGISVDPADDCTFWATNEYFTLESENFSDFAWLTRIAKFKFPECLSAARATITGQVTNRMTGQPIEAAVVRASAYSRMTDAGGSYGNLLLIPGTYTVDVSAPGFRDQTIVVTAESGQTITRNFELEPVAVIEEGSSAIFSESCSIDKAVEPGETVTIELSLHNTGQIGADNVTVGLIPSSVILEPGPMQNYGSLPVGGPDVSRSFNFTLSPYIRCGGEFSLNFMVSNKAGSLGTIRVSMHAGAVRHVLSQRFDAQPRSRLPEGWISSSTGSQPQWTLSTLRSSSSPASVFSPDPNQVGLNELVSPSVSISSRQARLTFRNWYDLETTFLRNRLYDGSVLEISIDGGEWQDILTAGGSFESGGYDGIIDSCCGNPLAGHMGWSGRSGPDQTSEFITSSALLPSSAAGHGVRFRWRVGTDIGTYREGQYIDNVEVTDGYSCTCGNSAPDR